MYEKGIDRREIPVGRPKRVPVGLIIGLIVGLVMLLIGGCISTQKNGNMKTLTIQWQRLVDNSGETCQRCGSTGRELHQAIRRLRPSLAPLGIEVILEKKALDPATCARDISQSNRIWINGQALEEWLDAEVGESPCDTACAELGDDVKCRTVKIEGQTYETIPAELIIKAGLLAAAQLFNAEPTNGCCPGNPNSKCKPDTCD